MKEITFINRNKDRWQRFEKAIDQPQEVHPDDLADQFIQLTDDLAYARTFYSDSGVVNYLNSITGKTHRELYKNKKEKTNRFSEFWKTELPLEIYKVRKYFYISIIIFLVSAALGVISAANDDSFVRLILGDAYVNQTIDNIDRGNPMGVYETSGEFEMFFFIVRNNIQVAFVTFVLGILTPLAVGFILFNNGVMLGAFQTFFYLRNLFSVSTLAIYIHGALEIPAIILAGGAGILVGNSLLFPGTLPRIVSLGRGVRSGMKIMLSLVPVLMIAGFFESFVTRHYNQLPLVINLMIIGLSLSLIIWYFFIFPARVYNKNLNA